MEQGLKDTCILSLRNFSRKSLLKQAFFLTQTLSKECLMTIKKTNNPFFPIPRSLYEDPRFSGTTMKRRYIYLELIRLAAYAPLEHNIKGNIIKLKPAQVCYSQNGFSEPMGSEVTRGDIRGALHYFERVGLLTQTLTHGKTLVTLSYPDVYELFIKKPNPESNQELTSNEPTKGELKNLREEHSLRSCSGAAALAAEHKQLVSQKFPLLPQRQSTKAEEKQFEELLVDYTPEQISEALQFGLESEFWRNVCLSPLSFSRNIFAILAAKLYPQQSSCRPAQITPINRARRNVDGSYKSQAIEKF